MTTKICGLCGNTGKFGFRNEPCPCTKPAVAVAAGQSTEPGAALRYADAFDVLKGMVDGGGDGAAAPFTGGYYPEPKPASAQGYTRLRFADAEGIGKTPEGPAGGRRISDALHLDKGGAEKWAEVWCVQSLHIWTELDINEDFTQTAPAPPECRALAEFRKAALYFQQALQPIAGEFGAKFAEYMRELTEWRDRAEKMLTEAMARMLEAQKEAVQRAALKAYPEADPGRAIIGRKVRRCLGCGCEEGELHRTGCRSVKARILASGGSLWFPVGYIAHMTDENAAQDTAFCGRIWLPCDGRPLFCDAYPELFAKIGHSYDTEVREYSFRLPNLNVPPSHA